MTKTEYTAAIAANQAAISALRTGLHKLRTIEKLSKSFPELKLVDASVLETTITAKKAEAQKLRAELSKARRIVKRMAEIEDIEAGRKYMKTYKQMKMYNDPALNPVLYGQKKPAAKKDGKASIADSTTKSKAAPKKPVAKPEAKKSERPAPVPGAEVKANPAA